MTEIDAVLSRVASLDEAGLGRPWSFRGRTLDVRNALYWMLVEAQEGCVPRALLRLGL